MRLTGRHEINVYRLSFLSYDDVVYSRERIQFITAIGSVGITVMDIKIIALIILLFSLESLSQDVNKEGSMRSADCKQPLNISINIITVNLLKRCRHIIRKKINFTKDKKSSCQKLTGRKALNSFIKTK
jgi:hypothetical protein